MQRRERIQPGKFRHQPRRDADGFAVGDAAMHHAVTDGDEAVAAGVALQEIDLGRRRSRAEDQAAIIARNLDMHAAFCPTVSKDGEHYGHALLSRWPVEVVKRAYLPTAPGGWWPEPRAAMWVRIVIGARRLNIFTTHLGLGTQERKLQMEALVGPDWLARPAFLPALLFGLGTVVFPYFVLQPALGLGLASAKAPNPVAARWKSLGTHAVFGTGLWLVARLLRLVG